jgi:glycosyltransferase involved in cell wall biosynthesis
MRMHVAVNGWFWSQQHVGSGQYLRRLLPALRQARPDITYSLILPNMDDVTAVPEGVDVVTVGGGTGNLAKIWFEQRRFPAAVSKLEADLAFIPYWGAPLSSPVPMVTMVLDVIPAVLPEYAASVGAALYTSLVTASARGSTHVLTLSAASKVDVVKHLGVPEARMTVTHLAVDGAYHPQLGAEKDDAVRQKYDLPDSYILYLGGYDTRKQVNELLLAYTYVRQGTPDVTLVLGGREPAWGTSVFPDMRAYAERLDLGDSVKWIGYVDEADKPSLYRMAVGSAYPSRYEGFGLPVLESMASGTPVVAWDVPVMQEIGGEGVYLVNSARELGGALLALINQTPLRDSLITQGLSQSTRYSWRKTARETAAVFDQVALRGTTSHGK